MHDPGRVCTKCQQYKEALHFKKRADYKGGLASWCLECTRTYHKVRYKTDPAVKKQQQKSHQKARLEALQHYSGSVVPFCSCCGEKHLEFLCIDHIAGGGTKHRKELKVAARIFSWLRQNNYPEGFRVLCGNCNMSLGLYGYCPHSGCGSESTGS